MFPFQYYTTRSTTILNNTYQNQSIKTWASKAWASKTESFTTDFFFNILRLDSSKFSENLKKGKSYLAET